MTILKSLTLRSFCLSPHLWSWIGGTTLLLATTGCGGPSEIETDQDSDGDHTSATGGNGSTEDDGLSNEPDGGGEPEPEPEPKPTVAVCGNGELEPGEFCDDGNTKNGDGCSANCLTQDPNYDCSTPGKPCENLVVCGNGRLEGDETCDDGNTTNGDGCSNSCLLEAGFACTRPGQVCTRLAVCGNGERERGEQCDDGNTLDDDGCSASCQLEDANGYWCVPGQACVVRACGDGALTPPEKCDDGNTTNGDGCSNSCQLEPGFRCTTSGCTPICGDGLRIAPQEACDDGNRTAGDGCSATCTVEPQYECNTSVSPSVCSKKLAVCGNGIKEPGEICETNQIGCGPNCLPLPVVGPEPECGNGRLEFGETCEALSDGTAFPQGCGANCQTLPGWNCFAPGQCLAEPVCGDGQVQPGEQCDVGASSDPGCIGCVAQPDYYCSKASPSVCILSLCGNGALTPDELCDDGNLNSNDGCSNNCTLEEGWICPKAGEPCFPRCGDGKVVGNEQCDLGSANGASNQGCTANCRVVHGYTCTTHTNGTTNTCTAGVCGDGTIQAGEGCDDGNTIAGDGCGPTCQNEPTVTVGTNPTVATACGDGIVAGTEECDDGNTTNGDGCSSTCEEEEGFTCVDRLVKPPHVDMQVKYRDFLPGHTTGSNHPSQNAATSGHPDFQFGSSGGQAHTDFPNVSERSLVGTICNTSNGSSCGRLDAEGKPSLTKVNPQRVTSIDSFSLWYRDTNRFSTNPSHRLRNVAISPILGPGGVNQEFLRLTQIGGADSSTYRYENTHFYPLNGRGHGDYSAVNCSLWTDLPASDPRRRQHCNYHFTTELRYFFQYQGGEKLTFRGDDDVWVFVNGRLAVDIGGIHGEEWGRVVLGDDGIPSGGDSDCSITSVTESRNVAEPRSDCTLTTAERNNDFDQRFGLEKGKLYEIALFQAERRVWHSNFILTLSGFLAPRSECSPICGDGLIVGNEVCDDGEDNAEAGDTPEYGQCNHTCTSFSFCGDGVPQSPDEQCDDGHNTATYGATSGCGTGCRTVPSCGDGTIQPAYEECDNGALNDDNAYGPNSCTRQCSIGRYCGDGTLDPEEICDFRASGSTDYGAASCTFDCQAGPRCGDGILNGPAGQEECDDGAQNGTLQSNCSTSCTVLPYCGDGLVGSGESCDWGIFASTAYGSCTESCVWAGHCGDGTLQTPYEECDAGAANDDALYNGCSTACVRGPRCGDALLQTSEGEQCDNGYNDDDYQLTADSCGPSCKSPASCGDGHVQSAYEDCDYGAQNASGDAAYGGCTTECTWGPYCGDGKENGSERCDHGGNNTVYSSAPGGCGYDCQPAPYCGDGERNGPEQCDAGTAQNTGAYGGCTADCRLAPHCGDGVVQADKGEQCDDGRQGSLNCSTTCTRRQIVTR